MSNAVRRGATVDWLNLTDYGGNGDGVQDETSAMIKWLTQATAGDVLYIPPGTYKYNQAAIPNVPYGCSIFGDGPRSVLMPTGVGAAIYNHGDSSAFNPSFQQGGIHQRYVIDGTNAGAGSIGLDIGDGWGLETALQIRHFNGAGSIGFYNPNRIIWSEKCRWKADVQDCTTLVVFDELAGNLPSHQYSQFDFWLYGLAGQNGVVLQNGITVTRFNNFGMHGNFQSASGAAGTALWIRDTSTFADGMVNIGVEADGSLANGPMTINLEAGASFNHLTGNIQFLSPSGATGFVNGINAGKFNIRGVFQGDSTFSNPPQPAIPANATPYTNTNQDAMVYVTGGTVSNIKVAGLSTGLTSGSFFVGGNSQTIELDYTVAPTWKWVWLTQSG